MRKSMKVTMLALAMSASCIYNPRTNTSPEFTLLTLPSFLRVIPSLPITTGLYFQFDANQLGLAEIVMFNRALSAAEKETLDCYVNAKYGIAMGHAC